jgi:hypothetical protein
VADRIYKGELAAVRSPAFPESSEEFNTPHMGGLVPFELMASVTSAKDFTSKMINGDLWLTGDDVWIRIENDGTIEIGIAGV